MKTYIFLWITIFLSMQNALQGMVYYSYLVTPDRKNILLVGDLHNAVAKNFIPRFDSRIEYLENASLEKPLPFILEFEENVLFLSLKKTLN